MPPGAGCRPELRRASRAGAQNSIQDAGTLRAPAPTIFLIFVTFFLSFGSRVFVIFLQIKSILGAEISYVMFSYCVSGV